MRIGIDLGGTKIEIIALSNSGEILHRERTATPQGDYQGTLNAIKLLIDNTEAALDNKGSIGVAIPGAMSTRTATVKNANSTCLIGKPLLEDLQKMFDRPVRVSNDANCFALSESVDGAAKDAANVFGVIVGTGTGAGIVINGQIVEGANRIGGEWGHNPLPWPHPEELPGPDCYCGRKGCVETFLSGPGLVRDYLYHGGSGSADSLTAEHIVQLAEQGQSEAEQALLRYEQRMAKSLAGVINILDPDVIILGGGLSNIQRLYENVPHYWGEYIFSDTVETRLLAPMYGDSSGVRGAAWLWPLDQVSG